MLHILVKDFQVIGVQELDPFIDQYVDLKYQEDYDVEYMNETDVDEGE